ncbi:MAG: sodium:solute symporter family transporter [Vicinamibacteraceae bacterium]
MTQQVTQSNFGIVDGFVLVGYLAVLAAIGAYFSRRQSNLDEYFRAGQSMGWLPVGLSLMAALNSGADYMTQPSAAIRYGLVYVPSLLTWVLAYFYVTRFILPFYRRLNIFSVYQYLERRFDLRVRSLGAAIFILWRVSWMGTALYVPCLALHAASGERIPLIPTIVLLGAVVTTYTALGGIQAVVWTDVIQFCVMILGLAVTVGIIVYNVEGGFANIWTTAHARGLTSISWAFPGFDQPGMTNKISAILNCPPTAISIFAAILISRIGAFTSDQMTVQRFQTAKSIKDERPAFMVTALGDVIWMLGLAFVGLALFAYYQQQPLPPGVTNDGMLPHFMSTVLPIGVTGLVIAAIMAASLSSVDSAINSSTTVAVVDFCNRLYLGRDVAAVTLSEQEERQQVRLSRIITFTIGAIGTLVACNLSTIGDLVTIGIAVVGSFAGPLLAIYLLGILTQRARSTAVLIGGIVGTIVTVYVAYFTEMKMWPATFGVLTTLVLGYVLSFVFPAGEEDARLTHRALVQRGAVAVADRIGATVS